MKKQSRALQLAIEDEVEKISRDTGIGEAKKGDLSGFKVQKFKFQGRQYLMAYRMHGEDIVFYMVGTHENFYRELKKYAKEVSG